MLDQKRHEAGEEFYARMLDYEKMRKRLDESVKRELELSVALCNMLMAFTCFEEKGLYEYPEDLQKILLGYRHEAREVYVGHPLPPTRSTKDGIELDPDSFKIRRLYKPKGVDGFEEK